MGAALLHLIIAQIKGCDLVIQGQGGMPSNGVVDERKPIKVLTNKR